MNLCYSLRMENFSFDVVIIGSGPGGCEAARILAAKGAKVALVESDLVGGECLHWGCIPSKIYLHSAHLYQTMLKTGESCGVVSDGDVRFDFAKLVERRKKLVGMLHRGLETSLKSAGVTVIMGRGRLVGVNTVKVMTADGTEQMLGTKHVILATGSSPRVPDGVAIGGRIMTNREVFRLEQQPKSLLITGGGTVGCEMASFFAGIGTSVILVEFGERLLSREDRDVSAEFLKLITRGDVQVHLKTNVISMETVGESVKVVIEHEGETREEIIVDYALAAAGRTLNTDVCDYEACGVNVAGGKIVVDGFMRTSTPNVYAIGDVAGKVLLAYTAEREGEIAAYHILGMKMDSDSGASLADGETSDGMRQMDYRVFPSVIFTHPEIASVGLTEDAAKAAGKNVIVKKSPFSLNSKALVMGERDGFVKVVVEVGSGVVLGVHIIGPDATTMIDKATLAVEMRATAVEMLNAIVGHPVTSETLEMALEMVVE